MRFWAVVVRHACRNMMLTWKSQGMTLFTVSLSVLIFSFFYLVYVNALHIGEKLGDDLRLVVYLDEDPSLPLQEEYRHRILKFDQVERIEFISREQAFKRFEHILGPNNDVLTGVPTDFLPASIEVYPVRTLDSLSRIKRFSDYLQTLPGVLKVQYGKEWIERFYAFIQLMRVITLLSGSLLIMTTTFMVAHTIRLTLFARQQELELLRLVGATNNYIRTPFLLEGALQGGVGACFGLGALLVLYNWIALQFAGPNAISLPAFAFFKWPVVVAIIGLSTLLCVAGSFSAIRRFLHL
ncbi:MAG: ABC transporter permease [Desulfobulbus sp.]|jgi:cell division transport system permease protein|uniref:cell division protein FtsX n=1 Tax=Desulfobulbus sp. TaxID=895 RepID=UPI00283CC448|nr:permease-like cell division protein FtsX [Desulfobulbus sp.]MDR2550231.1 ABC transporter permease [Desulfobulbus sp.]